MLICTKRKHCLPDNGFHSIATARSCYHRTMKRSDRQRLMTAAFCSSLIPVMMTGSGCARITAASEVRSDGSMTRTVTYSGTSPEPQKTTTSDGTVVTTSAEFSMGPKLEDLVIFPSAAGGWKVTRTREEKSN